MTLQDDVMKSLSKGHAVPLNLRSHSQVMVEVIATVYSGTSGQRLEVLGDICTITK